MLCIVFNASFAISRGQESIWTEYKAIFQAIHSSVRFFSRSAGFWEVLLSICLVDRLQVVWVLLPWLCVGIFCVLWLSDCFYNDMACHLKSMLTGVDHLLLRTIVLADWHTSSRSPWCNVTLESTWSGKVSLNSGSECKKSTWADGIPDVTKLQGAPSPTTGPKDWAILWGCCS